MKDKLKKVAQQEPTSTQEALAPELAGLRTFRIAAPAYPHAKRRSFSGKYELPDWLRAEREIKSAEDALLVE